MKAWKNIQVNLFPLDYRWEFSKSAKTAGYKDYSKVKKPAKYSSIIRSLWKALLADECMFYVYLFGKMMSYFLQQRMGGVRFCESPFHITVYLWCPCYLKICCTLEDENICGAKTCLGSSFLCPRPWVRHFCTLKRQKVHNKNVQLTVKHPHQFRDHFQIWWMSSKSPIHSNHQAEKQLNSWGEKSR